jgi:hypothetical protein
MTAALARLWCKRAGNYRFEDPKNMVLPIRVESSNPTATVNQKRRDLGITSRINLASLRLSLATGRGLRAVHPRLQREGIAPTA